jgi:hypothetical protein
MLIRDYLSNLINTINEFVQTGIILSNEIIIDFRTEKIGLIKGNIAFIDNSRLTFKEYLDLRYGIKKQT